MLHLSLQCKTFGKHVLAILLLFLFFDVQQNCLFYRLPAVFFK